MSDVISFDWFVLGLRLALVALLYLFLYQVARVTMREIVMLARREEEQPTGGQQFAHLIVMDPAASELTAGATFSVTSRTIVGRHAICDLVIEEPFVSGEHAELSAVSGQWFLRDLNSTNGTFLNGERVDGYADIHPGDVVQFGRVKLEFVS
ncbi:MAG: FHA domain-containing protein [Thermomicrobiales bacterium]